MKWGEAQVKAFVYGRGHNNVLTEDEVKEQFVLLDGLKSTSKSRWKRNVILRTT